MKKNRVEEIDFLKCVLIVLMVVFHFSWFGDMYLTAKKVVYAFHMPGFLLVSGYFAAVWRSGAVGDFLGRRMKWIFVPYVVMESLYAVASTFLPVRGGLEVLDAAHVAEAVLLHPVGPYWYLHTLMLCSIVWFFVSRVDRPGKWGALVLCALAFIALSMLGLTAYSNVFYFWTGLVLRRFSLDFTEAFRPGVAWLVPFILLVAISGAEYGVLLTYCAVAAVMGLSRYAKGPLRSTCLLIGRNSLYVLLFSPLFTAAAKPLVPYFSFDPSGLLLLALATTVAVGGSLLITCVLDRAGISPYLFGRKQALL